MATGPLTPSFARRPQRWDQSFSDEMNDALVDELLSTKPFVDMNQDDFLPSIPLRGLIRHDMRIKMFQSGEVVYQQGDYGHSAFLVLDGQVKWLQEDIKHKRPKAKGFIKQISDRLFSKKQHEQRDSEVAQEAAHHSALFLQDLPIIASSARPELISQGQIFGEISALGRTPRVGTVCAEGACRLLEIRWQGLREILQRTSTFRAHVEALYRERGLITHLRTTPFFNKLSDVAINAIADATLFETYGHFDWYGTYRQLLNKTSQERIEEEPIIAKQGAYADGLLLIRSGFARVSVKVKHGYRTISYIGRGGLFGLEELVHNWQTGESAPFQRSLHAIGYVDVLRVPSHVVESLVLSHIPKSRLPKKITKTSEQTQNGLLTGERRQADRQVESGFLEFLVEERYINGTATMLIDLDKCVRCDDCVKACADTHEGNPRFIRHGKRYGQYMVANACMHCVDPVCMIGCPTAAIARDEASGQIVINDETCIGCASCANGCPYNNIQMVSVRDETGHFILDDETNRPLEKATKCDLCLSQPSGPACEAACSYGALKRIDMQDMNKLVKRLQE